MNAVYTAVVPFTVDMRCWAVNENAESLSPLLAVQCETIWYSLHCTNWADLVVNGRCVTGDGRGSIFSLPNATGLLLLYEC